MVDIQLILYRVFSHSLQFSLGIIFCWGSGLLGEFPICLIELSCFGNHKSPGCQILHLAVTILASYNALLSIIYTRNFIMTDYEDEYDEEDLDLSTLDDDELIEQIHDDLYNGLKEEVAEGTDILLERGWGANKILNEVLVTGMTIVGIDFRDGILFVPEVLMSANAMKQGMAILKPLLSESDEPTAGKMVIGTVKGDIHDIGKNLVCMMMEGAGFEVIDLGINIPVETYLSALEEHKPDILGMSALLTTTMPYMKVVIDTLQEKGIRDDYIVLVGGAPLNQEFGDAIGADGYCRDAAVAADMAKELVAQRRAA